MTLYNLAKYFCLSLLITNCSTSNYLSESKSGNSGINFTEGKWLIYPIDVPYNVSKEINELVTKDFKRLTPNRFSFSNSLKVNLPIHADSKISETDMQNVKMVSGYDYLVILSGNKKDNLGAIDLTNHKYNKKKSNTGSITLLIYDLNKKQLSISEKVVGSFEIAEGNNSDVTFNRSSNSLLIKSYKKLIKKLKSRSLY